MRLLRFVVIGVLMSAVMCGCASWNVDMARLRLGMEPSDVQDSIGKPFTIRAAKVYGEGEEWSEVWEYLPPAFTWNPKTYWVYFENGHVVQWGEPGDFTGSSTSAIREYNPNKSSR